MGDTDKRAKQIEWLQISASGTLNLPLDTNDFAVTARHTIVLDKWCPMEYKRIVQTVVETPTYLAIANKLFSEEERAGIVALVAADPECGDVILGTGGFRKVRVARKGMGAERGLCISGATRGFRFF